MNDFTLYTPTRFVFARGATDAVGEWLARQGYGRALLVYGKGSVVRSGTLARVVASLDKAGISHDEMGGVRPNPELSSVCAGRDRARELGADVVVPVGGGSAIDCAKAIAFSHAYDASPWDFFDGKVTVGAFDVLPVAAVLTIPAAGSEASDSCVISNDELGLKRGVTSDLVRPRLAFMDPELTFTLPAYQTAAGVTDMIAHICERWFSGVGAVTVTDGIAASLIRSIMELAPRAIERPDDYDARAGIMWASTLAHDGLAGAGRNLTFGSRAGGWESHGLEHELSALYPRITHGAGLAVMMPAWMRYVWRSDPQRFLDFARQVFDIEPAYDQFPDEDEAVEDAVTCAIDELQRFFASIGMPTRLSELGVGEQDIETLMAHLEQNKGSEFGAFRRLTMDDARAIYRSAL